MNKNQHIRRALTLVEQAKVDDSRRAIAAEREEILSRGKIYKQEADEERAICREILFALKAARLDQAEHPGVQPSADHPNLVELENAAETQLTIAALHRYATAMGKELKISLVSAGG
ncbi:MAG: hypothetical protein SFX18_05090 [Pirellulales bacterium]|nr:hypothetical protein [Pirellulales bacterium]